MCSTKKSMINNLIKIDLALMMNKLRNNILKYTICHFQNPHLDTSKVF